MYAASSFLKAQISLKKTHYYHKLTDLDKAKEAAKNNNMGLLVKLTQANQSINQCLGYTALHIAALVGEHKLIAPLVEMGVDSEAKDKQGLTAKQLAEQEKHIQFVEYMNIAYQLSQQTQWKQAAKNAISNLVKFKQKQKNFGLTVRDTFTVTTLHPYAKLLQIFWHGYSYLSSSNIQANFLCPPASLLNSYIEADLLSTQKKRRSEGKKAIQKKINSQIKKLQKLREKYNEASLACYIEQLIQVYVEYHHLLLTQKTKNALYQTPNILIGKHAHVINTQFDNDLLFEASCIEHQHFSLKLFNYNLEINYILEIFAQLLLGQSNTPDILIKIITPSGKALLYQAKETSVAVSSKSILFDKNYAQPSDFVNTLLLNLFLQKNEEEDPLFCKLFTKIQPEIILLEWLCFIKNRNLQYQYLVKFAPFIEGFPPSYRMHSNFSIQIVQGAISNLYAILTLLKEVIANNQNLGKNSLLDEIKFILNQKKIYLFAEYIEEEQTGLNNEVPLFSVEESVCELLSIIHYEKFNAQSASLFYQLLQAGEFFSVDENILHLGVRKNIFSLVEFVLNNQLIEVNLVDKQGNPPLFYALESANITLARLLIAHGAHSEIMRNRQDDLVSSLEITLRSEKDPCKQKNLQETIELLYSLNLVSKNSIPLPQEEDQSCRARFQSGMSYR